MPKLCEWFQSQYGLIVNCAMVHEQLWPTGHKGSLFRKVLYRSIRVRQFIMSFILRDSITLQKSSLLSFIVFLLWSNYISSRVQKDTRLFLSVGDALRWLQFTHIILNIWRCVDFVSHFNLQKFPFVASCLFKSAVSVLYFTLPSPELCIHLENFSLKKKGVIVQFLIISGAQMQLK